MNSTTFGKENFSIFTCGEVFEPPAFNVKERVIHDGKTEDRLKEHQISFPSFEPPINEKSIGSSSVVSTFVATTQDLFVSPTDGSTLYRSMLDRLETVPRCAEIELAKRWTLCRAAFLTELFTSSPRSTRFASALVDLLQYYEENVIT